MRHIIVVIRRYSSCWLERSPPMATDIYKSTTRHAFVVSSFVELPPGARHRCVLPFTDHTLRTLRLTHHGTGAARGKVGPWCDHVKNPEWTRLMSWFPLPSRAEDSRMLQSMPYKSNATEHDFAKPD